MSSRSRQRKLAFFFRVLGPQPAESVVDIGVSNSWYGESENWATENFLEATYPWPQKITAVGLHDFSSFPSQLVGAVVSADGRQLPFRDKQFDIAFSNAVLEHVGSRTDQRRFVEEMCRVAKRIFLTTPDRGHPIEVHSLLPVIHWLPRHLAIRAYAYVPPLRRGYGRDEFKHLNLLSRTDLMHLLPTGIAVTRLGTSLVAYGEPLARP